MLLPMRKAITLSLSVALLGIFAAVVVAAVGPSDGTSTLPASSTGATTEDRTTTTEDRTTTSTTPNAGVDISGPCDEAEHANDPRCAGVQVPAAPAPPAQNGGVDISGPCDEAEHVNDPRCAGVGADGAGRVDNSGPGSVNSGHDDLDDDDSSGPGPGGDDDHGFDDHGGDDFDDDSSGSGHGGGDNSGHGGGDD
jgi:hypothetical protein